MKVKIFTQHTHAGITYPAGSEIDLPEADALWLISAEHARRIEMLADASRFDRLFRRAPDPAAPE